MAPPPVRSRMARCTSLLEPPSQAEKMSSTKVSTVRKCCDESVGRSQKKIETKYELRATNREVRQCSSSYENTNYMDVGALSGEHDSSLTSLHIQCPIVCGYSNELRVKQRPVSFMRNSLAGDVTQNVKWRRDASSWLSFMTHLWYKIYLHYRTLLLSRLKCHFCKSSKYQVPAVAFCSSDGHIAAM